jgi:single-stranded DNA-binding protein
LKFDQWNAQDGSKRSKLRVFVENFEFLGRSGGGRQNNNQTSETPPAPTDADVPYGGGMDDDIPF